MVFIILKNYMNLFRQEKKFDVILNQLSLKTPILFRKLSFKIILMIVFLVLHLFVLMAG